MVPRKGGPAVSTGPGNGIPARGTGWCPVTFPGRPGTVPTRARTRCGRLPAGGASARPPSGGISRAFREVALFCCPDCELNFRSGDWDACVLADERFYDCTAGACPSGRRHTPGGWPGQPRKEIRRRS